MPKRPGKAKKSTPSNAAAKRGYATPALEKGLDVLELLSHEPKGLTKTEIARRLDRTVSEIFRMLLCLEDRGYLAKLGDDRYSLTLKLFKMVQEHPPTERLIAEAMPVMHQLAHDTQQSCHLAVIEGSEVVFIAQVNAPTSVGFYVKVGSSLDMMEAASGYVLLAHQSTDHRERTLQEWKRVTGRSVPADLQRHLVRIAKAGFEEKPSYQVHGITNVSFPVFNAEGSAVAALTAPFIERKNDPIGLPKVTAALKTGAAQITAAIGGRVPTA